MEREIVLLETDAVSPLRRQILRPHQRVFECSHPSDYTHDALHVGATVAGHLASVATIAREPFGEDPSDTDWRVRGMATLPEAHGLGLGGLLLETCIKHAEQRGARLIWCNARTPAVGFYRRFGFEVHGTEFQLPNIGPHYVMVKDFGEPGSALG